MSLANGRKLEYEKIRIFAMFFTIAVHCLNAVPNDTVLRNYLSDGLYLLFYTCNGLFFLLSGKFAIATKCDSFDDYYRYYAKKLIHLIIPVLCYMFLRNLYDLGGIFWKGSFWKSYIENVFYGYAGNEYWFLYTLLGLVILAPFFNKMAVNMNKGEIWLFIAIGLLYNAARTYSQYIVLTFAWQYVIGGWAFYFILGYFLEKVIDTPRKENVIILLGGLSFIISMVQKHFGLIVNIHDLAPTYTMITCAVFFLLKRDYSVKIEILNRFLVICSKYSFAIYMVHNPVKSFILDNHYLSLEGNYLWALMKLVLATFVLSFLLVFICDNTFVRGVQWCFQKLLFRRKDNGQHTCR